MQGKVKHNAWAATAAFCYYIGGATGIVMGSIGKLADYATHKGFELSASTASEAASDLNYYLDNLTRN